MSLAGWDSSSLANYDVGATYVSVYNGAGYQ